MLSIFEYKSLIALMPVQNQSSIIRRKNWIKYEGGNREYRKLNDRVFRTREEVTISRKDLFGAARIDNRLFILKTIYWGYPAGMRGDHFKHILCVVEAFATKLATMYNKRHGLTEDDITAFLVDKNIKGAGLSVKTKLLYFMDLRIMHSRLLILDQRVINVLSRQIFDEYGSLHKMRYDNATQHYMNYVHLTHTFARRLKVRSDKIEMFLHTFGMNLKK